MTSRLKSSYSLLITVAIFFIPQFLFAQSDDIADYTKKINIIPPSPAVAALGTYGGSSPNLVTGAPSISIPLHSLQVGIHSIPISISYNTSGVKVDELPGLLGSTWALHAGGVISRHIIGRADDEGERIVPPQNSSNWRELNNFLHVANIGALNLNNDAQPDIFTFSFGAESGSFYLDRSLTPVLINHSGIRIETDFGSSSILSWNFKITAIDGTVYLFGGNNDIEKSGSRTSDCTPVPSAPDLHVTAWFLNKIIYTNGDEVNFTYVDHHQNNIQGFSETMYKYVGRTHICSLLGPAYTPHSNTICKSVFSNYTRLLSMIDAGKYGVINFEYQHRKTDFGDELGDKLLKSITVWQSNAEKTKSFSFEYINNRHQEYQNDRDEVRTFLHVIRLNDALDTEVSKYKFDYIEIEGLPARLTKSQDHWGYYNGYNNTTLVARPSDLGLQNDFPLATANREVAFQYARKGMLQKITYPTGGYDFFDYYPNTVSEDRYVYNTYETTIGNVDVQGSLMPPNCNEASAQFTIPVSYDPLKGLVLTGYADPPEGGQNELHNVATITLTGSDGYQRAFVIRAGIPFREPLNLSQGVIYTLTIKACWNYLEAGAGISFFQGTTTHEIVNDFVGGMRIKSVETSSQSGAPPTIKFYKYASIANPERSSGRATYTFKYDRKLEERLVCPPVSGFPDQLPSLYDIIYYRTMFSSSLYNLYPFGGSVVQYEYVTESIGGENFENGGIQHKYTVQEDVRANPIMGDEIGGAPFGNYSIYSGREIEQLVFDNSGKKVRKVISEYTDNENLSRDVMGYSVSLRMSLPPVQSIPPAQPLIDEMESYNMTSYELLSRWIYKSKESVYNYNANGTDYLLEEKTFEYANPSHALPTKITTKNSKGESIATEIKYPGDYSLVTNTQPLQSKENYETSLATVDGQYNDCIATLSDMNCYPEWNTSTAAAATTYIQTINDYYAALATAAAATTNGQNKAILTMQHRGIKDAVIEKKQYKGNGESYQELAKTTNQFKLWGNGFVYPHIVLSSVKGEQPDTALICQQYDDKGNLQQYTTKDGITTTVIWGYNKIYPVAKITGAEYATVLPFVNQSLLDNPTTTEAQLLTALNFIRSSLAGTSAMVSTYTYKPGVGTITETGPNGKTVYYDYDDYGRLKLIKDHNRNILKKYDYQYHQN